MNDGKTVFEVKNLSKTFHVGFFRKRVNAVKNVSFSVNAGEVFGLLGPNGAGKTTLIKTAMGLIFPTSGKVSLFAADARRHKLLKDVGYLPENPYFHEYLTPRELLDFFGSLYGLSRGEIRERRDKLIDLVGLSDAAKLPLRKFSKGMLQRIGLAQALIGEPKLLVLDEPMSGLDPIGRRFVVDLILDLKKKGTTIIFSSHILSDVERLCNRVVILNKGNVVAEGSLKDLLKGETGTETLESLFMRKALEMKAEGE
jgi:ABC-2 type transport system ATP-binding protein